MGYPSKRRHVINNAQQVCWCGSTHSWELAEDGYCECKMTDCKRTHR